MSNMLDDAGSGGGGGGGGVGGSGGFRGGGDEVVDGIHCSVGII